MSGPLHYGKRDLRTNLFPITVHDVSERKMKKKKNRGSNQDKLLQTVSQREREKKRSFEQICQEENPILSFRVRDKTKSHHESLGMTAAANLAAKKKFAWAKRDTVNTKAENLIGIIAVVAVAL